MSESKRTTIYLDSDLHRTLKIKAAETNKTISQLIDDAIRRELAEDNEDLAAFRERGKEPTVAFEEVLKELKANGKI